MERRNAEGIGSGRFPGSMRAEKSAVRGGGDGGVGKCDGREVRIGEGGAAWSRRKFWRGEGEGYRAVGERGTE